MKNKKKEQQQQEKQQYGFVSLTMSSKQLKYRLCFLRQLVVIVPNAKTITVCFHVLCWASNFCHCFASNCQLCGFYADWKNQSEKNKTKTITICSHAYIVTSMTFTHSSPSWFPPVSLWIWSKTPYPLPPSLSISYPPGPHMYMKHRASAVLQHSPCMVLRKS